MGIDLPKEAIALISVIVVLYLGFIIWCGGYFAKFSKNVNDFFYGGQRFSWWLGVASMVATGISSYSYLKYSQQGYETGISSCMNFTNDWFITPFFLFGWLPIIYFARVKSIPEYFERRFNKSARYVAVVILLAYLLYYLGYNFFTMGIIVEGILGVPMLWSVVGTAAVVALYVTMGGQMAVLFTDLLQGIMLWVAGLIAIVAGIWALGGFGDFWGYLPLAHRLPFVDLMSDPSFNTAGLFWGEALAGSIAFSFMNQGFLMKYMTLKSVDEGRKACLVNVLITLPVSALVVGAMGWIAKALIMKQTVAGGALVGLDPIHISNSYHTFMVVTWAVVKQNALLAGLVFAILTAALMSTTDTLINACAAIGVYDIYKPLIKKDASEKHYLAAARWLTILVVIIGVLLVLWFIAQKGTLMKIHYKGIMTIIPPIVTTIFMGAFWRRFTPTAAVVSMSIGAVATFLSNWYPNMIDPLAWFVNAQNFTITDPQGWARLNLFAWFETANRDYIYMRALFGMILTGGIGTIVTYLTKAHHPEKIVGLTVDTLDESMRLFKGSEHLNFTPSKPLRRLSFKIDCNVDTKKIALSAHAMEKLKAHEGDLLYFSDSRWWLGGLRSDHAYAAAPHNEGNDVVIMNPHTAGNGYLVHGKTITVEKIF
jgi:SSS family solute:Na+ symporter